MPTPLDETMIRLAKALADTTTLSDTVHEVVAFAVESTGTTFGGITVIRSGGRRFTTLGATDPRVEKADHLQYELREGPCVDAAVKLQSLYSGSLRDDDRWPRWGPAAADMGFHSIVSAELHAGGQRIGALNLYGEQPRQFATEELDLAKLFAAQGAGAIKRQQNEDSLLEALDTRTMIGQAQGILMERFGLDADQAFSVLRRYSQDSNRRLRDIVAELVTTRDLPRLPREMVEVERALHD